MLALIDKSLRERTSELADRIVGVVGVVAASLAGEDRMDGVMKIIIPLGAIKNGMPFPVSFEISRLVSIVLENEVNLSSAGASPHRDRQRVEKMRCTDIFDRVDGVETQPVHMIFVEPIERVVDKKVVRHAAKIDRLPPARAALGKERR